MIVNIDNLEAFMYVVHLKSVHKASKALFLSQPTVTARIKSLERELNAELFIRQGEILRLLLKVRNLSLMLNLYYKL